MPVYGFGGKPKYPGYTLKCISQNFPMTGDPNQVQVEGLEGLK